MEPLDKVHFINWSYFVYKSNIGVIGSAEHTNLSHAGYETYDSINCTQYICWFFFCQYKKKCIEFFQLIAYRKILEILISYM
jgi:hypothetical protein